ncbi:hypothetical protein GCM10010240_10760 [Streptomyces griseoviridis]|nr:hypothetical protein GCM10010240_10760 [Streptomyces griseoviridis]
MRRRTGGTPFVVEETARCGRPGSRSTRCRPGSGRPCAAGCRCRAGRPRPCSARRRSWGGASGPRSPPGRRVPRADTGRLLAQAARAHPVEDPGDRARRFVHDPVREAPRSALDTPRRHRLHAAAVPAPTAGGPGTGPVLPADLAHHAHRARDALGAEDAVGLLVKPAARDAANRLAHDGAAGHYERTPDRVAGGRSRHGVPLALDLRLALQLTGGHGRAWNVFAGAVARARERADAPCRWAGRR